MSSAASGQQGELEVREARIAATVRPRLSDKIRRWYVIAAAALLNAIILFLLVNLVPITPSSWQGGRRSR